MRAIAFDAWNQTISGGHVRNLYFRPPSIETLRAIVSCVLRSFVRRSCHLTLTSTQGEQHQPSGAPNASSSSGSSSSGRLFPSGVFAGPAGTGNVGMAIAEAVHASAVHAEAVHADAVEPRAVRVYAGRNAPAEDRSYLMPAGCTLRKYIPLERGPYWHGKLPKGRTDAFGRKGKCLTWGFVAGRSEADAINIIEDWLRDNGS